MKNCGCFVFCQEGEDDGKSLFGGLGGTALPVFDDHDSGNGNVSHVDYNHHSGGGSGGGSRTAQVAKEPAASAPPPASKVPSPRPLSGE